MTQEQLAEQLEVSRQAVSKWESGQSYPEMEKLLIICDMFHCDMDSLVKGDLTLEDQADAAGYDRFMNGFSCRITGSITLILAAVTLMAFLDGLVHEDILAVFLIAAAGVAVAVMIVSGINKEAFEKKISSYSGFLFGRRAIRFYQKIWYCHCCRCMPDSVWNLCEYRSGFHELSIKGTAFRRIFPGLCHRCGGYVCVFWTSEGKVRGGGI